MVFGLSAEGLRRQVKTSSNIDITNEQTTAFRNRFLTTYEGIYSWHKMQVQVPEISSPWGRQWTDLPTGDKRERKSWRTRLNYPVQAAEAEGLKEAMVRLYPELHDDWKLVNVVHDSVLLEVPKTAAVGLGKLVQTVPTKVDVKTGESWELVEK